MKSRTLKGVLMRAGIVLVFAPLLLFCLAWLAPLAFAAPMPKVEICHIPPGDRENFHTIRISEDTLAAHLAHGDLGGACDAQCETLCDDGDVCTIDACAPTGGCAAPARVDCDDRNLCTTDSCDPASGCANIVAVTCDAPDACTLSTCARDTGECVDSPVVCSEGGVCAPETGLCGPVTCPCFTEIEVLEVLDACENPANCYDDHVPYFPVDRTAIVCDDSTGATLHSVDVTSNACFRMLDGDILSGGTITPDEYEVCHEIIHSVFVSQVVCPP